MSQQQPAGGQDRTHLDPSSHLLIVLLQLVGLSHRVLDIAIEVVKVCSICSIQTLYVHLALWMVNRASSTRSSFIGDSIPVWGVCSALASELQASRTSRARSGPASVAGCAALTALPCQLAMAAVQPA